MCTPILLLMSPHQYTANVLTIKTTGTGNCGGPAGKICTIYGKGLSELQGFPAILTEAISSPGSLYGQNICSVFSRHH